MIFRLFHFHGTYEKLWCALYVIICRIVFLIACIVLSYCCQPRIKERNLILLTRHFFFFNCIKYPFKTMSVLTTIVNSSPGEHFNGYHSEEKIRYVQSFDKNQKVS